MSAKPGFMLRLIAMRVRAFSTSRMGLPERRLDGPDWAARWVTRWAPTIKALSVGGAPFLLGGLEVVRRGVRASLEK